LPWRPSTTCRCTTPSTRGQDRRPPRVRQATKGRAPADYARSSCLLPSADGGVLGVGCGSQETASPRKDWLTGTRQGSFWLSNALRLTPILAPVAVVDGCDVAAARGAEASSGLAGEGVVPGRLAAFAGPEEPSQGKTDPRLHRSARPLLAVGAAARRGDTPACQQRKIGSSRTGSRQLGPQCRHRALVTFPCAVRESDPPVCHPVIELHQIRYLLCDTSSPCGAITGDWSRSRVHSRGGDSQ
jgi:hypothetical protein